MPYRRILFLLAVLLWTSGITSVSLATSKIVILTSKTDNSELTKAANQGLLSSFQQTYQEGQTVYPLSDGYQIELANYPAGQNAFATYSNDKEVVALLCLTDTDCEPVLKADTENMLVIALTATASILGDEKNVLRMVPSNKLEGKAIYKQLKQDSIKRFAVLYEPTLYAMNLYNGIISEYFVDVVKASSATVVDKPTFVSAFPITDFMGLSPTQRGTTATVALSMLPRLNLDAVVFAGGSDAFKALTDSNNGGHSSVVKNWYSSDAIYSFMVGTAPVVTPFSGLRVTALYAPDDGVSPFASYYYAFDAGTFLQKVMASSETTEGDPLNRDQFLELAKKTNVPIEFSKTGAKSFTEADNFAWFNLHIYSAVSDNPVFVQGITKEISISDY